MSVTVQVLVVYVMFKGKQFTDVSYVYASYFQEKYRSQQDVT